MTSEPEPSPRRRGLRETAAAVGVAAVIATFGGAAIYAATEGSSHSFGAPHQAVRPGGGIPGGPGGPGGQHGAIGGPGPAAVGSTSLHGEFVVPDGSGGYRTVLTQTGTVTAISPTSITVRSADGYSRTYVTANTAGNAGPPFVLDAMSSCARHATARPRPSPTSATRETERSIPARTRQAFPPSPSGWLSTLRARLAPSSTWWFRRA